MTSGEDPESGRSDVSPAKWWTVANALTAIRLVLIPVLVMGVTEGHARLAFGVFGIAVLTDFMDGRIARRRGEATPFGGFFDHVTDALFVAAGLAALSRIGLAPVWISPLLLAAFVQYTLDSHALEGRPLRASMLGRWNGIAYYVALGVPVVRDGLGLTWPPDAWVLGFGWGLVATTLLSMGDRALALIRDRSRIH